MILKTELSVAERAAEYDDVRIEISVHDDDGGPIILLNTVKYEEGREGHSATVLVDFPPIAVNDLLRAIASFGYGVMAWNRGEPPYAPQPKPGDAA